MTAAATSDLPAPQGTSADSASIEWSGDLNTFESFREAGDLYRRVFGYYDPDLSINANLMSALVMNGGSVVGARDAEGTLVGFAYGFPAIEDGRVYHYSQAAVVDRACQGKGVGRTLKNRQRESALAHGQTAMRWAFDPLLARNAHFNLDVLGASAIRFVHDFYARTSSDRLLIEWDLTAAEADRSAGLAASQPPPDMSQVPWCEPLVDNAGSTWIRMPSSIGIAEKTRDVADLRAVLRRTLDGVYAQGQSIVSCRRLDASSSLFLAAPGAASLA
ncbi:GNAT family N-acetyltransferase [Rarobacter incanus]|uniref:Putative GNAT superfamily acetyltransferase n=1 Tax=Rarobacter incanus TaxID=153494 RepID=A0A542SNF4_9MICO|nr:GNAT family N-acetyltransferase [Rarobacter incanus]TQK76150.1 putative GNAT superfamily acetyltransferase [Rarobacter incanus]